MIKHQKNIYIIILAFSVLVNLFVLGLLFFVLRDTLSDSGDYFLEGKSFWYFIGVILAYSLANCYFIINLFMNKTSVEE